MFNKSNLGGETMSEFNDNNNQNEISDNPVSEIQTDATAEPIMAGTEIISGVEKAKKSSASIIAIIAIILVVLLGGSAAAYNFSPWVKNNVKMLINDPEDYYAWVENENIKESAEVIAEAYDKMTNSKNNNVDLELRADLDKDAIASLIESNSGVSLANAGITIPDSISITEAGTVIDGNTAISAKFNANEKTFLTVNGYIKDGIYYYQIPELSSSYIQMDLNKVIEEIFETDYSLMDGSDMEVNDVSDAYITGLLTKMSTGKELQEILTDDELEDLLIKYFDIVFTNIDDVKLKKDVECEVNGVKTEYNQLIAEIDEGCLYSIAKDVLKKAKDDKTIIKIVESTDSMTKEDYQSAVEKLIEQLGEYSISGGETVAVMNVYVDSKGVIKGRSFEIADEEDVKLNYMSVEDNDNNAFEANIIFDGEGFKISGDSKENSNRSSGKINVTAVGTTDGDKSFDIEFKDIKVENEDKGYRSGEINLNLSALNMGNITVNLNSDGKSQEIATDINVDGTKYAVVSLKYSDKKPEGIPDFNEAEKVYKYSSDGAELQQYIAEADMEGFLKGISDIIGIDLNSFMNGYNGIVTEPVVPTEPVDPTITEPTVTGVAPETPESASYDFSKIKIQLNGKDVTIPGKIDGVLDKVKVDVDKIDAGMTEYFYSDDGSTAVYVENLTEAALAPKDCTITGLSVTNESDIKLTVDGIGPGSKISDAVSKYGCKLDDPNSGYTYIEDSNNSDFYGEITLFYYDGIIYEVDVDFYG